MMGYFPTNKFAKHKLIGFKKIRICTALPISNNTEKRKYIGKFGIQINYIQFKKIKVTIKHKLIINVNKKIENKNRDKN